MKYSVHNASLLLVTTLSLLTSACTKATELQSTKSLPLACQVVGVHDGDTITCLSANKTQYKVRLNEIDAPELKQAFGKRSKQYLSHLIYQKEVLIQTQGQDRYHRTIGTIYLNHLNINLEMVKAGYAWAYTRYVKHPAFFVAQEKAHNDKRGLWVDPHPINPADFRHFKRKH